MNKLVVSNNTLNPYSI